MLGSFWLGTVLSLAVLTSTACVHQAPKNEPIDLPKYLGIDYGTCVNCESGLTDDRKNLIESAIDNDDTAILNSTLNQVGTPMPSWDRSFLNRMFAKEMLKGPACDERRLKPLADKGATLELPSLRVYDARMVFCNAGLNLGVIPFYMLHQPTNSDAFLTYLMVMQKGLQTAIVDWHEGQINLLNGAYESKLEDREGTQYLLRRFGDLIRTIKDTRGLATLQMKRDPEARASAIHQDMDAMIAGLSQLGDSLRKARDRYHPNDRRTKVYDFLIKNLPILVRGIQSPYEAAEKSSSDVRA